VLAFLRSRAQIALSPNRKCFFMNHRDSLNPCYLETLVLLQQNWCTTPIRVSLQNYFQVLCNEHNGVLVTLTTRRWEHINKDNNTSTAIRICSYITL
jgi:hypothetical protein